MSFNLSACLCFTSLLTFIHLTTTLLSQTNDFNMPNNRQSRIVDFSQSHSSSNLPRGSITTHTTNLSMAPSATPKYSEEYGLHILQIRRGQKVPHARLASELAKSSKVVLSAIIKDILPLGKATKLIKTLHLNNALAEWIESAETLALGPHPKSKLACMLTSHGFTISY